MNNIELIINITAVLAMLAVSWVQGYMLGHLMMGKVIEWYDIYMVKKKVPEGLCCCGDMEENHGYHSNHSIVYAVDYGIENAKKWSRG